MRGGLAGPIMWMRAPTVAIVHEGVYFILGKREVPIRILAAKWPAASSRVSVQLRGDMSFRFGSGASMSSAMMVTCERHTGGNADCQMLGRSRLHVIVSRCSICEDG